MTEVCPHTSGSEAGAVLFSAQHLHTMCKVDFCSCKMKVVQLEMSILRERDARISSRNAA